MPVAQGQYNRGFSMAIAPPGTEYRSPIAQAARQVPLMSSQAIIDEAVSDSSDDEATRKNNIPSSTFGASTTTPSSIFGAALAQYSYSGQPSIIPRHNGVARSSVAPTKPQVRTKEQPLALEDVDWHLQQKVKTLMAWIPAASVRRCDNALQKCQGDLDRAHMLILDQQEREAKLKAMEMVHLDLTEDNEDGSTSHQSQGSYKRPGQKSSTKVQVQHKSIREKYAQNSLPRMNPQPQTQSPKPAVPAVVLSSSPVKVATPPQPVRRRLQQGRRNRSPSIEAPLSPVDNAPPPPRAAANRAKKRLVESDDEEENEVEEVEAEADVEETDDESCADEAIDLTDDVSTVEQRLLDQLNTCSVADLVDLSTQPREVAEIVLTKRPFESLDDVRAITINSTSITKNGKTRTIKKKVGDRLVDVCLEMVEGYEAVDHLVEQCHSIAEPISTEMKSMGMDLAALQAGGELSFTDIDHDSGMGTPCSSLADDDSVRPSANAKRALGQPSIMNKDMVMKDYQIAGLNWLALMWRKKLSCILADDMGLGKTCQVVSFVSHLIETGNTGPHLIVVPGSTLENWYREFERFSPSVKVKLYHASQSERAEDREVIRELLDMDGQLNVIVTTYDIAVKPEDNAFFKRLGISLCVFDEGHALKNSTSQRYTQLMRISAQMRLLLTGTPLQNNLQELISLLAFIMPKLFREHADELENIFKHKAKVAEVPGSQEALLSQQRILRARSMMAPFILRRKKAQVLKHIPAKTCRVEYCDMSVEQAAVYKAEITKVQDVLKARVQAKAAGDKKAWTVKGKVNNLIDLREAAIHPLLLRHQFTDAILNKMVKASRNEEEFNALTKDIDQRILAFFNEKSDFQLHQYCQLHPSVRKYDPIVDEEAAILNSGKVTALINLLLQHRANGDRTLVFSRFTMVLDILDLVLTAHNLRFCRLDGSTMMSDRQDLIDTFYKDSDISVFMLSTGAGGAGINLAAANKVIIFDMSFNPQDDIQAENRAHRVGQTREVEVVRLVTRGTVEEQIYRLGETKMALDERVAGHGAAAVQVADVAVDGDDKAAEGKLMDMLYDDLKKEEEEKANVKKEESEVKRETKDDFKPLTKKEAADDVDMKDAYKIGLRSAGLDVKDEP